MIQLNLGCGDLLMPAEDGWVNVDYMAMPGVDVVHNLDEVPWPWPDGSVSNIMAFDIFEHVLDAQTFMLECGRVLEMQGLLRIRTPHWQHKNAYTDPTHVRFPTEETLDYWIDGTEFHKKYGAAMSPGMAFGLENYRLDEADGNQYFFLRKIR